ncbi:MAG: branched-chain amino acid ABC transporter permease, partial [Rhodospirillales bacterium]
MAAFLDDLLFAYGSLIYGIGVNAILALSMYVVLALGQLSMGQAAFMGVGAYTGALLTLHAGLPFPLVLAAAALAPALVAVVIAIPTMRLSGVYLAIATIGLGQVLRIIYLNTPAVGGALGLNGIPEKSNFWIIYGLLAVFVIALQLAVRSKIGRAFEAIREDEDAARVMGIDVARYKLVTLVISAALAGIAGALNAHYSYFIGPNEYGFEQAVSILSYAVLGGISTPIGPVLGAFVLTALPEVLRPFHDFRLVFNGLIIVLVVIFLPRGLLG